MWDKVGVLSGIVGAIAGVVALIWVAQERTEEQVIGEQKLLQRIETLEKRTGTDDNLARTITATISSSSELKKLLKGDPGPKGEIGPPGGSTSLPDDIIFASLIRCRELGDGWSSYEMAEGRFILGVGKGPLKEFVSLERQGGEEGTKLRLDQIPNHEHLAPHGGNDPASRGYVTKADEGNEWGAMVHRDSEVAIGRYLYDGHKNTGKIAKEPGAQSTLTNMPPYIALHFCKKN